MKPKLVSIIVVNFNRLDLLRHCLAALAAQDYPAVEMVVVDNGSSDGSREFLAALRRPGLKTVLLDRNSGFTGGNIAGLALAQGDYVALVNNDAEPAPDWVRHQVRALERHPEAGFTACKILRHAEPDRLDCAGDGMTTSSRGFKLGQGHPADSRDQAGWVFGASAAAALYRRSMLQDIGFLDPTFFFNCEDSDLSFRAQLMGWKCRYVPEAVALHHVSASCPLLQGRDIFYWSRNSELLWLKNMPAGLMLRYFHHRLFHEAGAFVKNLKDGRYIFNLLLGKLAILPLLLHALRERRRIQSRRRISPTQLAAALTPVFSPAFLRRKAAV